MGLLGWILLIIVALIAAWFFSRKKTGSATAQPPTPAYPNPQLMQPTAVGFGTVIPQGSWAGPTTQLHGTDETYTFTRQTYNAAGTANPLSPTPNVAFRFQVTATGGEIVAIKSVSQGQAVPGTPYWAGITDGSGEVRVDIAVSTPGPDHQDPNSMTITADELDIKGNPVYTSAYVVTVDRH